MKKILILVLLFSQTYSDKLEDVFTDIYDNVRFHRGYPETRSGRGSMVEYTAEIRTLLPKLIEEYEIETILDVPCADFNWMKEVDLSNVVYEGGDIVKSMIRKNNSLYKQNHISFFHIDVVSTQIKPYDLVICRDLLLHLSNANIKKVLKNIKDSGSKYLLLSTFPHIKTTQDIQDGSCRPVNVALDFFEMGPPLFYIDEKDEKKHLGLWKL